jgi:hypothetical protein
MWKRKWRRIWKEMFRKKVNDNPKGQLEKETLIASYFTALLLILGILVANRTTEIKKDNIEMIDTLITGRLWNDIYTMRGLNLPLNRTDDLICGKVSINDLDNMETFYHEICHSYVDNNYPHYCEGAKV